jgi:hypothetical protein
MRAYASYLPIAEGEIMPGTEGKRAQFWLDLEWVDESKKADDDQVQAFIGKLSQAIKALRKNK